MENENIKVLFKFFVNIDYIRRFIFLWYVVIVIDNFFLIYVLNLYFKLLFMFWILKDWIKEYVVIILNVLINLKLVEIFKKYLWFF